MRRFFYYSFLIFFVSVIIGLYYSIQWKNNKLSLEQENVVEEANFMEEKVGINTKFEIKKYYNECGHSIVYTSEIPNEFLNKTEEEISNEYPEWNIEEFSKEKIVLSKRIDSLCDEHFVVREEDKSISIYCQKSTDDIELYKDTNISTEYLTEKDKEELRKGIYVYGKDKLNSVLEDFE